MALSEARQKCQIALCLGPWLMEERLLTSHYLQATNLQQTTLKAKVWNISMNEKIIMAKGEITHYD